jgi:uncharacterized membrane protein
MILSINYLYWLAGIILTITALMTFADSHHPRRWTTGLFWAIFAVIFLVGDKIPPIVVGCGAVLMALLADHGLQGREFRALSAAGRSSAWATACSSRH